MCISLGIFLLTFKIVSLEICMHYLGQGLRFLSLNFRLDRVGW